jgi:hypothetical protein
MAWIFAVPDATARAGPTGCHAAAMPDAPAADGLARVAPGCAFLASTA